MAKRKAKIFYVSMDDFWRKEEKLAWLRENPISKIAFESITPDEKHNWINQTDNDWDDLVPVADKNVKAGKSEVAIFKNFSYGFDTKRDEFVFGFEKKMLVKKVSYFIAEYNKFVANNDYPNKFDIKWSRNLEREAKRKITLTLDPSEFMRSDYRPFTKKFLYFDKYLVSEIFQWMRLFSRNQENTYIAYSGISHNQPFQTLASAMPHCGDFLEKTQAMPRFVFDENGERQDNITDWAVEEFGRRGASGLTKEDIFHYVYAVLHYPPYREKYEQNLKREFPRIPVYKNALEWAKLGKELMELHLNYETVEPYMLVEKNLAVGSKNSGAGGKNPVATAPDSDFVAKPTTKLRADKAAGVIEIDSHTSLEGVPQTAWEYKLGNRSALEWILDQYKERKPKDPTIAEKFNTYKFEDYKDHVIDLLKRVCTVSVKTMEIINSMPKPDDSRDLKA
ncbi:MAG: type ISP restriction/modification enzyme [Pyrinomonadaceae bacterium]